MDKVLEKCPTCIRAKQTKKPAGPNSTRIATEPYPGLSIDFSFSGTKSKDKARQEDYVGLNGETAWILVTDHKTGMLHGDTRVSKASPLSWLRDFLKHHSPTCPGKYAYLDQGGELYHNPEVVRSTITMYGQLVPMLPIKMALSNELISLLQMLCVQCFLVPKCR